MGDTSFSNCLVSQRNIACRALQVLDYESNGSHQFIGACDSSLQQLKALAASPSPTLDLVNPKKSGQKGYYHSGVLSVREATVNARPSFLQYITGK